MKNLFYIHRFPFNKEAFNRDEFAYFISEGYHVKYLDISTLLKKKDLGVKSPESLKDYIIPFDSKKSFKNFLLEHKDDSVIITDVGLLANSAWMYVAIFNAKLPYVLFENSVLPKIKNASKQITKTGFLKLFKRFNYSKIYKKPVEMFTHLIAKSKLYPAKMIITSKPKLSAEKRALKGKDTIMKYSMSLDYKVAMDAAENNTMEEPYAVFVDQYFVHHPDFKTNHIVHFFTAEEYYTELNNFLADFSAKTGLKIVIASHPRRSEQQTKDFNPDFEIHYNKTAELVKHSRVALIHFSTAINFAVIFKKPFLLLDSDLFKNSSVKEEINMFSNYFGQKTVNTSDYHGELESIDDRISKIDEQKYDEFLNTYIKHPKAEKETFREQISFILDKL